MALLDKFQAVNVSNGVTVDFKRIAENRMHAEWRIGHKSGAIELHSRYYTDKEVQDELIKGSIFITNPVSLEKSEAVKERELPATFYFTTLNGVRYTARIQDDLVTVAWGEGIWTQTMNYPLSYVKASIRKGYWKVLEESYRSRSTAIVQFMQYMEQNEGPLTDDERVAVAQTLVLLNRVMYGE